MRIWSHPVLFCKNHRGIRWFLLSLSVVPLCGSHCWVHTLSRFLRQLESSYSKLMLTSLCIMNTNCPLKKYLLGATTACFYPLFPEYFTANWTECRVLSYNIWKRSHPMMEMGPYANKILLGLHERQANPETWEVW